MVVANRGSQQQALDLPAGGAVGVEAGGDDSGVIAKEGVPGTQVLGQIAEMAMGEGAGFPVDDEQARFVSSLGRLLGDQPFRQRVVEEIGGQ